MPAWLYKTSRSNCFIFRRPYTTSCGLGPVRLPAGNGGLVPILASGIRTHVTRDGGRGDFRWSLCAICSMGTVVRPADGFSSRQGRLLCAAELRLSSKIPARPTQAPETQAPPLECDSGSRCPASAPGSSGGSSSSHIDPNFRVQRSWKTQRRARRVSCAVVSRRLAVAGATHATRFTVGLARGAQGVHKSRYQESGIRMMRSGENPLGGADFQQASAIEDGDPVAQVTHSAKIVRDVHISHSASCLQVGQQIEDCRLHRHVEGPK